MVEIGAFQNCTSLTSFAFPQSLSEVQGWTFVGCRKLKEITLPKSVKKVGDQALRTNSTVETITFEGEEAPELTGNPFPFKESILKIMVPSGKSEAYKAKWDSYESYHSKIEENQRISHIKKITACTNSPGNSYTLLFFNTKHWL